MSVRVLSNFLGSHPYFSGFLTFRFLHFEPHNCWRLKFNMAANLSANSCKRKKRLTVHWYGTTYIILSLWKLMATKGGLTDSVGRSKDTDMQSALRSTKANTSSSKKKEIYDNNWGIASYHLKQLFPQYFLRYLLHQQTWALHGSATLSCRCRIVKKKTYVKTEHNSWKKTRDLSPMMIWVALLIVNICSKFQVDTFINKDMSKIKVCHTNPNINANTNETWSVYTVRAGQLKSNLFSHFCMSKESGCLTHSGYLGWWEPLNPSAVTGWVICIKLMHNRW